MKSKMQAVLQTKGWLFPSHTEGLLNTLTEETGFELGRRHAGGIREAGRVKWRRWI